MANIEHASYRENGRRDMLDARASELAGLLAELDPGDGSGPGYGDPEYGDPEYGDPEYGDPEYGAPGPDRDGRTETLITQGRMNNGPGRAEFFRSHWKTLTAIAAAAAVLGGVLAAVTGEESAPATWPPGVTAMQGQVTSACRNPDVAAEPTGTDFACGTGSRQVLWVFALLTSGGNPGYVDSSTGRKGLEPITPAQGGNVAWSLNLHAPYDPAQPVMSIEVAARAINNIVGGATLTGSSGQPQVQGGLESSAANCARYTGSKQLLTRAGYPALCARPLTAAGKTALVADVFRQWMPGAPVSTSADAGVLFAHANDPGNARVRAILAGLPGTGTSGAA